MATLWTGGTIYTMARVGETVEGVLEHNGKIVATGEVARLLPRATTIRDLKGNVMYPGFVDSHLHIVGYGERLKHLDVSGVKSKDELLAIVRTHMLGVQPDAWVIVIGFDEMQFAEPVFPTLAELDELGDAHVIIKRSCHHLLLANTKALTFAGITNTTPSPQGGIIDKKNGRLTGVLKDTALYLIVNHMPHITPAYIEDALTKSISSLQAYGLVGGHSEDLSYYGSPHQSICAFRKIVEDRQSFKVHLLQHHAVFQEINVKNLNGEQSPYLEFGAMKIFVDGAFGGRTAALKEPYCDDLGNRGVLVHTTAQLEQLVQLARRFENTVAVHAIGDLAIHTILNVLAKYPPKEGQLDRLIHCSLIDGDILVKLATLPVAIDVQPQFVQGEYEQMIARLGEKRAVGLQPIKSLLDGGMIVAGGSDAPIEEPNPLHGIYAAVTRRNFGETHDGYGVREKISRFEAVRLYTICAAEIIGQQHKRGRIAVGYSADFTVFTSDLFAVDIETLPNVEVAFTVIDGRIVYKKKSL